MYNFKNYNNKPFYNSKEWHKVSKAYMESKNYICERCGKPAQICHHKKWLNGENVNDPLISLNFDNLEALCIDCHNAEHSLKHNVTIFNSDGTIAGVKETPGMKEYRKERAQLDSLLKALDS